MDLIFSLCSCGILYCFLCLRLVQESILLIKANFKQSFCIIFVFSDFHEKIGCYCPRKGSGELQMRNQGYLVLKIPSFCKTLLTERSLGKDKVWMAFVGQILSQRYISFH